MIWLRRPESKKLWLYCYFKVSGLFIEISISLALCENRLRQILRKI